MEINDLNRILDEGKLSEADEVGDAAAKPTATVDSPAEEASVSSEEKDVEKQLDDEHVESAEDVASVPVTEEAEAAAKPVATAEKEPEEAKPETEVKAVKDMQDCETAENAEEVEPVEITEDEALDYLLYLKDNLSEEEFASAKDEALNEGLINFFRHSGSLKDKWAAAKQDHVANKYDRETKHALNKMDKDSKKAARDATRRDDKAEIADLKSASKSLNYNTKKVGKAYEKFLSNVSDKATADKIRDDHKKANTKLATQLGKSVETRDAARRSATEAKNSAADAKTISAQKAYAASREKTAPARAITEGIVEDNLEVEPEIVKAEDKFEDGVAIPIAPVETPAPEVEDIPSEQPEKELNDVLDDKVEETPAEEKSTYDLVTESLDNILASLKEEAEAAAKPVVTTEEKPEDAKPETEVKAVKDMQDCENAEKAEEVEPVEITESDALEYLLYLKNNLSEEDFADIEAGVLEEGLVNFMKKTGENIRNKAAYNMTTWRNNRDKKEAARLISKDAKKAEKDSAKNVDKTTKAAMKYASSDADKEELRKATDELKRGIASDANNKRFNATTESNAKFEDKQKKNTDKYLDNKAQIRSKYEKPVEIKESSDELSIADMVAIVTEAAKRCKEKGKPAGSKELCEEVAAIVGDSEGNEFNVDKVINSKDVAEMGTEKNEKEIEKADDLHEEAEAAAKPVATTEEKPEEACPVGTAKEVEKDLDAEEVTDAEEVEAVTVKESVKYNSIKEACMLDEDYFSTDSYSVDTADEKFSRLTEQVALLMARESNDPMYNELLKEAVYTKRLQEAICEKYHSEAEKKACKIAKKKQN